MLILFLAETWAFIQTKITTSIEVDTKNAENLIRLNFNVTLFDVQCDFVSVGECMLFEKWMVLINNCFDAELRDVNAIHGLVFHG